MRITAHAIIISIFSLAVNFPVFAQNSIGVQWQHCFGGTAGELGHKLLMTKNGDIAILGSGGSSNGDLSGKTGAIDIILAVFAPDGVKKWAKNYGRANLFTERGGFSQTSDGGFIIATNIGGRCRTGFGNEASKDVWVIKTDSLGVMQWSRCYGGSDDEEAKGIYEMADGNFVFAASARSKDFDVVNSHPDYEMWVVKIKPGNGDIIWSRCFGGSGYDLCTGIRPTDGNNVIISGTTVSNDGDISGNHSANEDAVLAKFDGNGNLLWFHCYGGTESERFWGLTEDPSGNYYAIGNAVSNNGDVSGIKGSEDIWVVKTDHNGNLKWQKALGGSRGDYGYAIAVGKDSSLEVCGMADSRDGDFATNYYRHKFWVSKLDIHNGSILLQAFLSGTEAYDEVADVIEAKDGGILAVGTTIAKNPYADGYKGGIDDIWLVKLGAFNALTCSIYVDRNLNGIKDANEPLFSDARVSIKKNASTDSIVLNPFGGKFIHDLDTGSYSIRCLTNRPYYTPDPLTVVRSYASYYNRDSIIFRLVPIPNKIDLVISGWPATRTRPGSNTTVMLLYKNVGTETVAAKIKFAKDRRTDFVSSAPAAASTTGDTLTWNLPALNPPDSGYITIVLHAKIPSELNVNDTLLHYSEIAHNLIEQTPIDNKQFVAQRVVGGVDPNDKQEVSKSGKITNEQINNKEFLTYLVRFQNVGTDTAFNIVIRDTISALLDITSFEMISASHPYKLQVEKGNIFKWIFSGIKLVDSVHSEPGSHGYISYRIRTRNTLVQGDTIMNSASVYFDFNLPVKTNTEKTAVKLSQPLLVMDPDNPGGQIVIYPNPFRDQISIKGLNAGKSYLLQVYNVYGQQVYTKRIINQASVVITNWLPSGGIYWFTLYDERRKRSMGSIKLLRQ